MMRALAVSLILLAPGVPAVRAQTAGEPTPGYASVQQAFLREEFQSAAALAERFITEHVDAPERARVQLWFALSLDRLERANDALKELDALKSHLRRADALWPEALYWEGEISRRALLLIRARLAYQRVIERAAESSWAAQARIGLGMISMHEQAYRDALAHFAQAGREAEGEQGPFGVRVLQAVCHLKLQEYEQARALLEPALEQAGGSEGAAQAGLYLGEALTGLERFGDAREAYRRVLDLAEDSPWGRLAWFGLGWAAYRADDCGESLEAFERYVALGDPEFRTEALFANVDCFMRLGRTDEASALYDRLVSARGDFPLAVERGLAIADAYRRQGQLEFAQRLLMRLLGQGLTEHARAQIRLQLGALALEQGDPDRAASLFEQAGHTSDAGLRQASLNGLGDVHLWLGAYEQAAALYEQSRALSDPNVVTAYATYQLARAHLELGETERARSLFEGLMEQDALGRAEEARLALALMELAGGERERARHRLETVRLRQPGSQAAGRAAYYLALLAAKDDSREEAAELVRETLAYAPGANEAVDATITLAELTMPGGRDEALLDRLRLAYEAALPRQRAAYAKRLGDLERQRGRHRNAIAWYARAGETLPSLRGETRYWTADCHEAMGEIEEAIRRYMDVTQHPWRVRARLAAAKLLERQGRTGEARGIYESLAQEPVPEAKVARERLGRTATQRSTE
ncbi:MAG TPA: tetratricopeptide repeat protein [bacterium]